MVCKEEVFTWFKELSGAKRIELMCGLMSMCIPLEIRFFGTIIQDLAKKDYHALREAEIKANSTLELESICAVNLCTDKPIQIKDVEKYSVSTGVSSSLSTVTNQIVPPPQVPQHVPQNVPQHVPQQVIPPQVIPPQVIPVKTETGNNKSTVNSVNDMTVSTNGSTVPSQTAQSNLSSLSSRSKLVVSLCLLSPQNRSCSAMAYKALHQQLTANNVTNAINQRYYSGNTNCDDLYSEILLLLTMAVHHPAFSYEQQNTLSQQKEDVERAIESIANHYRTQTQNPNSGHVNPHNLTHLTQFPLLVHHSHHAHQQHQYGHLNYVRLPNNVAFAPQPLSNMSNIPMSSLTLNPKLVSPVSSPSPTSSPSSAKTSVAAISPLPFPTELSTHGISIPESVYSRPITGLPQSSTSCADVDLGYAKSSVSCYNCGNLGHRGDECTAQTLDEATR